MTTEAKYKQDGKDYRRILVDTRSIADKFWLLTMQRRGWRIVESQSVAGDRKVGSMIFLGLIFLPLAFLAGKKRYVSYLLERPSHDGY